MVRLTTACAAAGLRSGFAHFGGLLWSMFYAPDLEPRRCARLWEADQPAGAAGTPLVGFTWVEGDEVVVQVPPSARGADGIGAAMLRWAEDAVARAGHGAVATAAHEHDRARGALLERAGYRRRAGAPSLLLERPLTDAAVPLPGPAVPEGLQLRHVRGAEDGDLEARVAAHREAFAPSRFTLESYRRLRAAPGYAPELDVVAVPRGGTVAACCLCYRSSENVLD
jgi:predicted N-acetyltransferase YhbS